jgi:(p)ppGpp synthase/HD superfamily hydrolase
MRCADGVCVALLHDVIEDTDVSADDLRQAGMGEEVVTAVELLTRDRSEPRADYIARIKENPLARAVKLADLRHNSDLSRLDTITDRDLRRYEQYQREIAVLEGV